MGCTVPCDFPIVRRENCGVALLLDSHVQQWMTVRRCCSDHFGSPECHAGQLVVVIVFQAHSASNSSDISSYQERRCHSAKIIHEHGSYSRSKADALIHPASEAVQ